jgi:DNA polymerase-3 subunit gamma/tau
MPYVPLHHKYRPQTFAQLVGQDAIATTLSHALTQRRIAPAYLFTGARGTGKTSSARIFAKSLNCLATDRPTATPCGTCETCYSITQGSSLDVIEIDAASNTGVDNIRELIERAQFAPVQCRYKVYVIDEVHMLSNAAFNALLKTLEEPPQRVVFILATTDPQRVLPTIISRCQRFDFRRIPLEAMVAHLQTIAQQETIAISTAALNLVGQISQGGLRDAESLLDQLSLLAGEVSVEQVWDLVGAVPERDLLSLVQAVFADNPEATIDALRRLMDRGREPLIVLQNLASFYRDLLIAKTAPQRQDLVAVTLPTWQHMCEFVQVISPQTLLLGQQHLRSAEVQLKHTTQPRLWLEITLMGLLPSVLGHGVPPVPATPAASRPASPVGTQPPRTPSPPVVVPAPASHPSAPSRPVTPAAVPSDAPAPAPPAIAPASVPAPAPPPAPSPTVPPTEAIDCEAVWQQILDRLDLASTKSIITPNCFLIDAKGSTLKIGVRGKSVLPLVKAQLSHLSKACAKALQVKSVKLNLFVTEAGNSPAPPLPSRPSPPVVALAARSPAEPGGSRLTTTPQPPTPAVRDPASETPAPWQPEDDVSRAAKSLASAFNGTIVNLDADEATAAEPSAHDVPASAKHPPEPGDEARITNAPF